MLSTTHSADEESGAGWHRGHGTFGDARRGVPVGPAVGYDYGMGGGLTIGGEANMLFYTSSGGFNAVNLLANLKYWF